MTTYALPVPTSYVDHQTRHTVVLDGPAYIIGPHSTRWHRIRSRVGWGDARVSAHEPGPNLPGPCPIHGHLALTLTADGATCACEVDA